MIDVAELLEQNLQEEEAALNKLKALASEFEAADTDADALGAEEDEIAPSRR